MDNIPKNSDLLRQQILESDFMSQTQASFSNQRDPDALGEQIFNKGISKRDQLQKSMSNPNGNNTQGKLIMTSSVSNASLFSDDSFNSNNSLNPLEQTQMITPRRIIANNTLNSAQFKIIALKYKENIQKINSKMESYKSKNKKKLFSIYRVFEYEKQDHQSMMHVYKRNLTPIRENYQQCNPVSPFENNFMVFSSRFVQSHFKQEYLNIHHDVQVSSKNKNFSTFSVIQQKPQTNNEKQEDKKLNESLNNGQQTNGETKNNKKNLKDNIKRLQEARSQISPEQK
ncbi:UNKNOWN [Stylonychia lemnae]|uniref:Uncharacterized protein n=1 Tax=Stylonychia lemnae TaxID=5949 RepID=A0A077ZSR5_STYLE|nr:UNKNOWN [Stylonychia lemnae]|eukprot:CDW71516.1 UNKNOWN [Stylonychia lemnae]